MGVKTIRLNQEEYDNVIRARNLLVHNGIQKLTNNQQKIVKKEVETEVGRFTLGLIVGLSATLLIKELSG